jgi:DNA-3-methyladenine glycosylase I
VLKSPTQQEQRNRKVHLAVVAESLDGRERCWGDKSLPSLRYHDGKWGRTAHFFPVIFLQATPSWPHLRLLYQMQCLELMQAGLSWNCIMGKWDRFESAFADFDVPTVARWGAHDVERLLQDEGIVRNRLKVEACINNARVIHQMETADPNSFILLLLRHHVAAAGAPHRIHEDERVLPSGRHLPSYMRTDFKTRAQDRLVTDGVHPSLSVHSLSLELKRIGMRFMGTTVVLSFMQAVGLMNHHAHRCFAFHECEVEYRTVQAVAQAEFNRRAALATTEEAGVQHQKRK